MTIFLLNLFGHQCPTDTLQKNLVYEKEIGVKNLCRNYNSKFSSVTHKIDYSVNTNLLMARRHWNFKDYIIQSKIDINSDHITNLAVSLCLNFIYSIYILKKSLEHRSAHRKRHKTSETHGLIIGILITAKFLPSSRSSNIKSYDQKTMDLDMGQRKLHR